MGNAALLASDRRTPTAPPPLTPRSGELSRLQQRAESLRQRACSVDPILATSYRRRASELELEVWILLVRSGDNPDDSPLAA